MNLRSFFLSGVLGTAALTCLGCDPGPLPQPPASGMNLGYPIRARPLCTREVIDALEQPGTEAISKLARKGANFTCGPIEEPPPLDRAIGVDDVARVRALLEAGADPNARWTIRGDRLPLGEAILGLRQFGAPMTNRGEIVRLLLQHGADPNARWCSFESRQGPLACRSETRTTPLMAAALVDQSNTVYMLLDAGANPNLEDGRGWTATEFAASEATFQLLLPPSLHREADALESFRRRHPKPYDVVLIDSTPLVEATQWRWYGRVRLLLLAGENANDRTTSGMTPLWSALMGPSERFVDLLLSAGADPNARFCPVTAFGRAGKTTSFDCGGGGPTPLIYAAASGQLETVEMLLRSGAIRNLRDGSGRTALDFAHAGGDRGLVDLLRSNL